MTKEIPAIGAHAGDFVLLTRATASLWRPLSRCAVKQNLPSLTYLGTYEGPDPPGPPELQILP